MSRIAADRLSGLDTIVTPMLAEAGEIALRSFRTSVAADNKGGTFGYDPVTEADRGIEELLRVRLAEHFPDHQITGEEAGTTGPPGRFRWLIDPIDGTKSFVTGSPLWGILLGLLDDEHPVAGWMHQPYIGETFAAEGGTSWLDRGGSRRSLATRRGTALADAVVYTTFPGMFTTEDERRAYRRLTDAVRLTRFGGDCYCYCLLAMGQVDVVVESGLESYDIVPLIPIIEAAGGVVTDRHGHPPIDGGFVVAAGSATLHAEALAIINNEERS